MGFFLYILLLAGLGAIVSLALSACLRSNVLCIIAATFITEILFDLYYVTAGLDPKYPDMDLLAVNITAFIGTPVIAASATVTVLLIRRLARKRPTAPNP